MLYSSTSKIVKELVTSLFSTFGGYVKRFATSEKILLVKRIKKKYVPAFLYFEKDIEKFEEPHNRINIKSTFVVIALRLVLKKKIQQAFI